MDIYLFPFLGSFISAYTEDLMLHFHGDEAGKPLGSVGKPFEMDQSLFDQDHAKSVKWKSPLI